MSSSPLTESPVGRPARWRSPAGWPLRTRIVATMIILLTVLGVAVGGTGEIFLRKQLYDQIDTKLQDAQRRAHFALSDQQQGQNTPPHGPGGGYLPGGGPPNGVQDKTVMVQLSPTDKTIVYGGILSDSGTDGTQGIQALPADAQTAVTTIALDNHPRDVDLGSLGEYRLVANTDQDGMVIVTGLPLSDLHTTLLRVALVTGGAVLIALVIAGWAGALIVRFTLRPLRRVASTASRVSELRLDRGEVELAQRVPEADTDPRTEVGAVGAALNRMLDHVGSALEARHASEMQVRQFVADASHELRTPLAAIRGYAELSRRSRAPISDEIAHVLYRVESEAKRMTVLVEDLLLLARLDAGRPLAHDPVDLTMLAVDAVSDAHAAGPRHYWQLDLPEEPVTVIGDGARLHQVLANLLANARTHTPDGTSVTVSVRANDDSAVVHVIDSGPGIPAELQPHIFERFARGDSSRSRAAGSTGLGLSIVHAVVTAHRGNVSVQSVPGQTVFTVVLPLVPPGLVPTAGPQLAQRAG
ncbi:sensor histidine kinase [Paractinoplanes globisporus]|uniref:histidine kinase n=1 Tax=Paractinoplanes globisporus TaxID=113565 RepID=A0ABW6WFG1_9ACTN|nr:HAMP domain-containing sensor histidine kinase [Actinoplanes globisporus]